MSLSTSEIIKKCKKGGLRSQRGVSLTPVPEESKEQISWGDLNRLERLANGKLTGPRKGQPEVQHLGMGTSLLVVSLGQLHPQCCVWFQEMYTKRRIFWEGCWGGWEHLPSCEERLGCWLCLAWRRETQIGHTEEKMAQSMVKHQHRSPEGLWRFSELQWVHLWVHWPPWEPGPASEAGGAPACIFLWFLQWPEDLVVAEGGSSERQGEQGEREYPVD